MPTKFRITFVCDQGWLNALNQLTDVEVLEDEVLYIEHFEEITYAN